MGLSRPLRVLARASLRRALSKAEARPQSARVLRTIPSESPQFYMVNAHNPSFPAATPTARPTRPSSARSHMSSSGGGRNALDASQSLHTTQPVSSSRASLGLRRKRNGACQYEQERRVKAVARIRRLEEIVAMKDRKIESLLHTKSVGSEHNHLAGAVTQREMAQRDRQNNAMLQKLRHRIAQQSQVISSYEDAMQSLRSGIKSTNLMELEEERNQLYIELRYHQGQLASQRLEIESQQQITKAQQESKRCALEKQKIDQEMAFFKARVDQLQDKLVLEQRKRSYDREVASNVAMSASSPSRRSVLASALEEMKAVMKKECAKSIQREVLKSPRSSAKPSPRQPPIPAGTTPSLSVAAVTSAQPPPRQARPQSAGPTRPHRSVVATSTSGSKPADLEPSLRDTLAAAPRLTAPTESARLLSENRAGAQQSTTQPLGAESPPASFVEGVEGDAPSREVKAEPS
ncbi:hypothetical protein PybrP1_005189, partial [[Pythium] brassicae (nom. inval.)]